MRKAKKIWLIAATVSVIAGLLMMAGAFAGVGFDFKKLGTIRYRDAVKTVTEAFDSISIETISADVDIKPSADRQCTVMLHEWEKQPFTTEVKNNTLYIRSKDRQSWLDHISINFESPSVTLYLPEKAYQSLTIESVTGNIRLPEELRFHDISIESVTANVTCDAAIYGTAEVKAVTGNICLHNVNAEAIRLETTTGNIKLDHCDAKQISAHAVTGNITGTLLSGKTFHTSTTTGTVKVPGDTDGGSCTLTTTTGNIRMELAESS